MEDKNLDLFNKGTFLPIDKQFMIEGHEVLQNVQKVQEKFHKGDTDTFINELRDSIAGYTLGFDLVNVDKHGFDCKLSTEKPCYLEVKSASFSAQSWQATFNDTTIEKAEAFKDKKVYLALAVWKNASDLLFICYGQNFEIGEFLEEKVKWFKLGKTVRSTQSIPLSNLIFNYGFKILAVNKTKEEVASILRLKSRSFNCIPNDTIIELKDFSDIKD
ncbi:MAG: hypothetical protein MJ080_00905 [Clostridia bacterium]|nr:hypothetical protein [Clostridia bacterium]